MEKVAFPGSPSSSWETDESNQLREQQEDLRYWQGPTGSRYDKMCHLPPTQIVLPKKEDQREQYHLDQDLNPTV